MIASRHHRKWKRQQGAAQQHPPPPSRLRTHRRTVPLNTVLLACCLAIPGSSLAADQPPVDFPRDVLPILSDKCFHCHGPDRETREADLRLDDRAQVFADRDGQRIVTPGQAEQSELWRRITSTDSDEQMPPADEVRQLTAAEVDMELIPPAAIDEDPLQ